MLGSALSSADTSLQPDQSASVLQDVFDNALIGIYTSTPDWLFFGGQPDHGVDVWIRLPTGVDCIHLGRCWPIICAISADRDEFKRLAEEHGEVKKYVFLGG
ncbi:hypothetical protein [Desulfonatronum parangueonense]